MLAAGVTGSGGLVSASENPMNNRTRASSPVPAPAMILEFLVMRGWDGQEGEYLCRSGKGSAEGDEILEHLEAGLLAFLGVELGGDEVAPCDGRGEGVAVGRFQRDERGVARGDVIAV